MTENTFSIKSPLAGATEPLPPHLPRLYLLRLGEAWAFLRRQQLSFWLVCFYLFLEYVRPQSIYKALDALPWSQVTIILLLIAVVVEGGPYRKLVLNDWLLLGYCAAVLLSSVMAVYPSEAYDNFAFFFDWVVIFWLISNIVNTKERFLVFMLTYVLWNLKMTQHGVRSWAEAGFGFRDWGTTCAPGWFQNSGECGIQMTMFLPVALFLFLAFRPYMSRLKRLAWLAVPASAAFTIVGSSSRGGVFGLGTIMVWLLLRSKSKYRIKALIYIGVCGAAFWFAIPKEARDRFTTMGDDKTSISRTTYWKNGIKIFKERPITGIGYYNWMKYYHRYYDAAAELPHNIFIQAGTELGGVGLLAFLALIVGTFVTNARTRRMAARGGGDPFLYNMAVAFDGALVGYLVTGFFVTVLYYPFFWINLAFSTTAYSIARAEDLRRVAAENAARWQGPVGPAPARALPVPAAAAAASSASPAPPARALPLLPSQSPGRASPIILPPV